MKVIELKNCGVHVGLFQSPEGAKRTAQRLLEEYHEMYAEMDEEDRETSQPLTTTTLEWKVERLDHHGLITDYPEMGWDRLVAFYSEKNGYFTLHEIEVKP